MSTLAFSHPPLGRSADLEPTSFIPLGPTARPLQRRPSRFGRLLCGAIAAVALLAPAAQARPSDQEIQALQGFGAFLGAFSTSGINPWNNTRNWSSAISPTDPCWAGANGWYGVTCDAAGQHIIRIDLTTNNVHGNMPPTSVFAGMPKLKAVNLNNNFIGGQLPDLSVLPDLEEFNVVADTVAMTGPIPALNSLVNLRSFQVQNNALTGPLPDLTGLTQLQTFEASFNQLTGPLPSLTGLSQLISFKVRNNNLTGTIPSLDGLGQLFAFEVGSNYLTGSIPNLSGLTGINRLNFMGNQLTGEIPSLHGLVWLRTFWASYNQLSGAIPCLGVDAPCNSGLVTLEDFEVGNNRLVGPFPFLEGLDNLQYFEVRNNQIGGLIKLAPGQLVSKLCPNPFDLSSQPAIDESWDRTTQNFPHHWWGPPGATASCDAILKSGVDYPGG